MVSGLLGPCSQGEGSANDVEHVKCADSVSYCNAQQVSRSESWSNSPRLLYWSGKLVLRHASCRPPSLEDVWQLTHSCYNDFICGFWLILFPSIITIWAYLLCVAALGFINLCFRWLDVFVAVRVRLFHLFRFYFSNSGSPDYKQERAKSKFMLARTPLF